jgi:hypothetical protein
LKWSTAVEAGAMSNGCDYEAAGAARHRVNLPISARKFSGDTSIIAELLHIPQGYYRGK